MDDDFHAIARKHFDGAAQCWFREPMGVHPHNQRAADCLQFTVLENGLTNCQHMIFVESPV
jgi:hypothetical protein